MNRLLCASAIALGLVMVPAAAQAVTWKALAVNDFGWGYATGYDESSARNRAVDACENRTGRDCGDITTSVPMGWDVVGVNCSGDLSTGGSQYGLGTAIRVAADKVRGGRCHTIVAR